MDVRVRVGVCISQDRQIHSFYVWYVVHDVPSHVSV